MKTLTLIRCFSLVMIMILMMSFLTALSVSAAAETPVVTNVVGLAYADEGSSKIAGSVDVYLSPKANTQYYYLLTDRFVDVYYAGPADNPAGSYFEGSLETGTFVTAVSPDPTNVSGIPVGADTNWSIAVPKPVMGQTYELKVVAYANGELSSVFSHSFYAKAPFVVTDGDSNVYDDNGKTGISDSLDVYVTPAEDGEEYYYSFDQFFTVDVYYKGETNKPVGSYFDGSLENGAFVDAVTADSDGADMIRVDADSDWKITIPKPTAENPSILKIVSKSGSTSTLLYTHAFVQPLIGSAQFGDSIEAVFENNSTQKVDGRAIAAVYDARGALVVVESIVFETQVGGLSLMNFNIDLSQYPASDYTYKVFFWNTGYVPLTSAVEN